MLDKNTVQISEKFRDHPLFTQPICGMNFGFMARRGYYSRPETLKQPELMAKAGVNWTTINMNFCQEAYFSRKVFLDFSFSTGELEIAEMVKRLHENGIHVLFKPCLTPLDSSWMGAVNFHEGHQIQGVENHYWEEWFESFRQAMMYFADLAERVGMDAMLIGCEYYGTEGHSKEWREIIKLVRERYNGPISYEFTFESRKAYSLDWFEELDFLSYSYYPPAAAPNGILNGDRTGTENDPPETRYNAPTLCPNYTREEMEEYLSSRKAKIAEISKAYFNKPIVFTEIGVRSSHGSVMLPYNFLWEAPYDGEEQANYMEAVLNTFWELPCWMGLFWWKWDETQNRPHYYNQPGVDKGFTIQGKPAAKVYEQWMEKLKEKE